MHPEASRILTTLNSWVNTNEVLTLLVVATISGLAGWLAQVVRRRRKFGWCVLYDERINLSHPSNPNPSMWQVVYQDGANPARPVTNGSLVVLVADLISFLASQPVTDQLRDTSYIACADLGGSKLDGACSRS